MKLFSDRVVMPDTTIKPALIEVNGALIEHVTPLTRSELTHTPDVDLGARLLAPAFTNTHTHLCLSALRGLVGRDALQGNVVEDLYFEVEQRMSAADAKALARVGAYECLLSGTAVVWEHYYHGLAMAEALEEVGLSAALAPTLQDLEGPGVGMLDAMLDETLQLDTSARWADAGIVAVLGPHATDTVSDRLWRQVVDLAESRALPIHAHVAQSPEELTRSLERHGCPPLTRLRRLGVLEQRALLVHGLYVGDDELHDLSGVTLGYCPAAQAQFDFPAPVQQWLAGGAALALGTDAGSCNDTMDIAAELRSLAIGGGFAITDAPARRAFSASPTPQTLAALVSHRKAAQRQRLSSTEVLSTVWSTPGQLHPRLPVGAIAAGHRANLLVLDLDHPSLWPGRNPLRALVYGTCTGAIHGLMVSGRWIGTRGDFAGSLLRSEAWQEGIAEATARLDALLARTGLTPR